MFYEEAVERLQKDWEIVLSDDEVHELVEQFKDTATDDLPEAYEGLTSADLFNILLFFKGWEKYPDMFMFMLGYNADGMPKFGLCVPD
jgi:hypothetical protein